MAETKREYLQNKLNQNRQQREMSALTLGAALNTKNYDDYFTSAMNLNADTEIEPININTTTNSLTESSLTNKRTNSVSDTLQEFTYNGVNGFVDFFEGLGDAVLGGVRALTGWINEDWNEGLTNAIDYDWSKTVANFTNEVMKYNPISAIEYGIRKANGDTSMDDYYDWNWDEIVDNDNTAIYDELYQGSLLNNLGDTVHSGVNQLTETVFNQLPNIAIAMATGGTSLGLTGTSTAVSFGSKALSLLPFAASAMGHGIEEADEYMNDSTYGNSVKSFLYGTLSGTVEAATEMIPFPGGNAIGGVVGKNFSNSVIKDIASSFIEEGLEEVVSDLVNPIISMTYKGTDSLKEYGTTDFYKGLGTSFLMGGLSATILGGGEVIGRRYKLGKSGYGYVSASNNILETKADLTKAYEDFNVASYNNDEKALAKATKKISKLQDNLETQSANLTNYAKQIQESGNAEKETRGILKYFTDVSIESNIEELNKQMNTITDSLAYQRNANYDSDYIGLKVSQMSQDFYRANGFMPEIKLVENMNEKARYKNGVIELNVNEITMSNIEGTLNHELLHAAFGNNNQNTINELYSQLDNQGAFDEEFKTRMNKVINTKYADMSSEMKENLRKEESLAYFVEKETNANNYDKVSVLRSLFNKQNLKRAKYDKTFNKMLAKVYENNRNEVGSFLPDIKINQDQISNSYINSVLNNRTMIIEEGVDYNNYKYSVNENTINNSAEYLAPETLESQKARIEDKIKNVESSLNEVRNEEGYEDTLKEFKATLLNDLIENSSEMSSDEINAYKTQINSLSAKVNEKVEATTKVNEKELKTRLAKKTIKFVAQTEVGQEQTLTLKADDVYRVYKRIDVAEKASETRINETRKQLMNFYEGSNQTLKQALENIDYEHLPKSKIISNIYKTELIDSAGVKQLNSYRFNEAVDPSSKIQGNDYINSKPTFTQTLKENIEKENGSGDNGNGGKGNKTSAVLKATSNTIKNADTYANAQIAWINEGYVLERELVKMGMSKNNATATAYTFRIVPKISEAFIENGIQVFETDSQGKIITDENGNPKTRKSKSLIDIETEIYNKTIEILNKQETRLSRKERTELRDSVRRDYSKYMFNLYAIDNNRALQTLTTDYLNSAIKQGIKIDIDENTELNYLKGKTIDTDFTNFKYYFKNNETFDKKGMMKALKTDIAILENDVKVNNEYSSETKNKIIKELNKLYEDINTKVDVKTVYGKIATLTELKQDIDWNVIESGKKGIKEKIFEQGENNFIYYENLEAALHEIKTDPQVNEITFNAEVDKLKDKFREFTNKELEENNKTILAKYGEESVLNYKNMIRDYLDTAQTYRVQNNLLSQEEVNNMKKLYPNYVPTLREVNMGGATFTAYVSGVKSTNNVMKRHGSSLLLRPLESSMQDQTVSLVRAKTIQNFGEKVNALKDVSEHIIKNNQNQTKPIYSVDDLIASIENTKVGIVDGNTISYNTFTNNGREVATITLSDQAMQPIQRIKDWRLDDIVGFNYTAKVSSIFRSLVTDANPFFIGRNAVRDLSDALYTSKHGSVKFLQQYGKSAVDLFRHFFLNGNGTSDLLNVFYMNGGFASTELAANRSTSNLSNYVNDLNSYKSSKWNLINIFKRANEMVELIPRFTEFTLSYDEYTKSTDTKVKENALTLALHDSADITTDFTRGGYATKALNRTLVPFLNAQVQGFSKTAQFVVRHYENGKSIVKDLKNGTFSLDNANTKELGSLLGRLFLFGLGSEWLINMLNQLIMGEDWDAIPDYTKDNYIILPFGFGSGNYFKIPRGRILGTVQNFMDQVIYVSRGQKDFNEAFKDLGEVAISNLSPIDTANGARNIFSPLTDIRTNTTWYGGSIETQADENKRPSSRYDSSTSEISKAIGKIFNYSPKKIDYLLEQYTGIVGDILLPATTKSSYENPSSLLNFIKNNTEISLIKNNKYRTDFYSLKTDLLYDKNDGNTAASIMYSYLNRQTDSLNELEDKVSNSTGVEQYTAYLTLREAYKTAIENVNKMSDQLYNIGSDFDTNDRTSMTELYYSIFGGEYALSYYSSTVKAKADNAYQFGIDYDTFYNMYMSVRNCTTKAQAVSFINKYAKTTYMNKLLLQYYCGIALTDTQKTQVKSYLKRKGISVE